MRKCMWKPFVKYSINCSSFILLLRTTAENMILTCEVFLAPGKRELQKGPWKGRQRMNSPPTFLGAVDQSNELGM